MPVAEVVKSGILKTLNNGISESLNAAIGTQKNFRMNGVSTSPKEAAMPSRGGICDVITIDSSDDEDVVPIESEPVQSVRNSVASESVARAPSPDVIEEEVERVSGRDDDSPAESSDDESPESSDDDESAKPDTTDDEYDLITIADDEDDAGRPAPKRMECLRCWDKKGGGLFKEAKHYWSHIKRHVNQDLFSCATCQRSFVTYIECISHEHRVHRTELTFIKSHQKRNPILKKAIEIVEAVKRTETEKGAEGGQVSSQKTNEPEIDCEDFTFYGNRLHPSGSVLRYRGPAVETILECYEIQKYSKRPKYSTANTVACSAIQTHLENVAKGQDFYRLGKFGGLKKCPKKYRPIKQTKDLQEKPKPAPVVKTSSQVLRRSKRALDTVSENDTAETNSKKKKKIRIKFFSSSSSSDNSGDEEYRPKRRKKAASSDAGSVTSSTSGPKILSGYSLATGAGSSAVNIGNDIKVESKKHSNKDMSNGSRKILNDKVESKKESDKDFSNGVRGVTIKKLAKGDSTGKKVNGTSTGKETDSVETSSGSKKKKSVLKRPHDEVEIASTSKKARLESTSGAKKVAGKQKSTKKKPEVVITLQPAFKPLLQKVCQLCSYVWSTEQDIRSHREEEHPTSTMMQVLSVQVKVKRKVASKPKKSKDDTTKSTNEVKKRNPSGDIGKEKNGTSDVAQRQGRSQRVGVRSVVPLPDSTFTEKEEFLHNFGLTNRVRLHLFEKKPLAELKMRPCSVVLTRLNNLELDFYRCRASLRELLNPHFLLLD